MKALQLTWLTAASSLAILSCGLAEEQKLLPSARQSPHFSKVAANLDLGGPIFTYVDVDGDLEGIIEFIHSIIKSMPPEASLPPEVANLDLNKFTKPLGIHGIKAKGMSSIAQGADRFHNKLFIHTPAGPEGLLEVMGDKPSPFISPDLAPANATLVIEQDLHLSKLKAVVGKVVAGIGNADIQNQYQEFLSQPASPWEMNVGEFFGKLNTRLTIIISLDQQTRLPVPEVPDTTVPAPDILIAVDDAKWIVDGLRKSLPPEAIESIEKGDGFEQLEFPQPMGPEPFDIYKPVFRYDTNANRFMVASRKSFMDACVSGSGAKLRTAASFKTAMTGLPASGNGLVYSTPELLQTISKTAGDIAAKMGQAQGADNSAAAGLKLLTALPMPEGVSASVQTNKADGILMTSNSPMSHKITFYTGGGAPMIVAGMAAFVVPLARYDAEGGFPEPGGAAPAVRELPPGFDP